MNLAKALKQKAWAEEVLEYEAPTSYRAKVMRGKLAEATTYLSSHCDTCGRTLTDPESIRLGRGPECRRKAVA